MRTLRETNKRAKAVALVFLEERAREDPEYPVVNADREEVTRLERDNKSQWDLISRLEKRVGELETEVKRLSERSPPASPSRTRSGRIILVSVFEQEYMLSALEETAGNLEARLMKGLSSMRECFGSGPGESSRNRNRGRKKRMQ